MPAFTSIALAGTTLATIGKGISANKQKNKYEAQLENLETPELRNYAEDIQISTLGTDLAFDKDNTFLAGIIDTLRQTGVRGVAGGIPKVAGIATDRANESRAYLDEQGIKREYAIADENARIRGINEGRYQADVAGLGNAISVADQNLNSSFSDIASIGLYGARAFGDGDGLGGDKSGLDALGEKYDYLNG